MEKYTVHTKTISDANIIAYREAGDRHNEKKLLLIHGNMSSSVHFSTLMEKLEENFHIIAVDLPGMGDSNYPKEFNSLFEFAEVISEFVEEISFDNFSVLGWSTGGGIALELAYLLPDKVKAVCLLSSVGVKGYRMFRKDDEGQPLLDQLITTKAEVASDPVQVLPILNILETNNREFMKKIWEATIFINGLPSEEEYEAYISGTMQQKNLVDIDYSLLTFNITDEDNGVVEGSNHIASIKCPIIIVHGENDLVVPLQDILESEKYFGDQAKLHVIKKAGHSIIQDNMTELISIIHENL